MTGIQVATIDIASDAPYFDGHFPDDPIVPGAHLLDRIIAAILVDKPSLAYPLEVLSTKFLRPVRPSHEVQLEWETTSETIRFIARVDNKSVVTGVLRVSAVGTP